MQDFLSDVMLITDQDAREDDDHEKVTLMTCHAAKGLEFKHVIVVGVEEELLPSAMAMSSADDVEEERRLMYVAMTRARETCMLTYAKTRFRNGQTVQTRPSRFLSEIGRKYVRIETSSDIPDSTPYSGFSSGFSNPAGRYGARQRHYVQDKPATTASTRTSYTRPTATSADNARMPGTHGPEEVQAGTRILHGKLGEGVVLKLDFVMGEGVITVRFKQAGEKKLYLRFAQFTIL